MVIMLMFHLIQPITHHQQKPLSLCTQPKIPCQRPPCQSFLNEAKHKHLTLNWIEAHPEQCLKWWLRMVCQTYPQCNTPSPPDPRIVPAGIVVWVLLLSQLQFPGISLGQGEHMFYLNKDQTPFSQVLLYPLPLLCPGSPR